MNVDITSGPQVGVHRRCHGGTGRRKPRDNVYFKVKLHPYRGVDEVKTMSFTVPKDQPLGDMVLESAAAVSFLCRI